MAAWWLAAAGGAQLASGLFANREAKKTARANARLIESETRENLRRMDREQVFRMGSATAEAGASGFALAGSQAKVLTELNREYELQRDWFKQTAQQRARMARRGGRGVGIGEMIQGLGNIGAGLTAPNPRVEPAAG